MYPKSDYKQMCVNPKMAVLNGIFLLKSFSGHFIQGPNGWEDVLTKGRMQGRCESNTNCSGTTAVSKVVPMYVFIFPAEAGKNMFI